MLYICWRFCHTEYVFQHKSYFVLIFHHTDDFCHIGRCNLTLELITFWLTDWLQQVSKPATNCLHKRPKTSKTEIKNFKQH